MECGTHETKTRNVCATKGMLCSALFPQAFETHIFKRKQSQSTEAPPAVGGVFVFEDLLADFHLQAFACSVSSSSVALRSFVFGHLLVVFSCHVTLMSTKLRIVISRERFRDNNASNTLLSRTNRGGDSIEGC